MMSNASGPNRTAEPIKIAIHPMPIVVPTMIASPSRIRIPNAMMAMLQAATDADLTAQLRYVVME